eukprot:PhF_6_TR37800/c0_g1_i2/m.56281
MNTAIVTGGARGLGEATVRYLVSRGLFVYIWDVNDELGKRLEAELGAAKSQYVHVDVTSEENVTNALRRVDRDLHVVVNSAGVAHGEKVLGTKGAIHSMKSFQRVININLVGSFNVMRLAVLKMSEQKPIDADGQRGVVINVASIAGYEGQVGQAAYSASKAALIGMTIPVARELSKIGIRVVTIAPGIFGTSLLMSAPDRVKKSLGKDAQFPARFGDVNEFAKTVGMIMDVSFLNGTTIRLDGAVRMSPM